MRTLAAVALAALAVAGPAAAGRPAAAHVAVVVMENREYGQVVGNPDAPFLDGLVRRSGLATAYHAVAHPSLPNYLALLGGSTFGIASDCTDCRVRGESLPDQLEAAGLGWRAYMEGLPEPCFQGAFAGRYAKKHDPFLYFERISGSAERCRRVVPLTQLDADLRAGGLPAFAWISPDLCHDTHDCPVATGDRFLAELVPTLLDALGPRGVLFLTWDEGRSDEGGGGRVATVVAGGLARRGAQSAAGYDHYSLLRTVESLLGLPPLGNAARARPLTDLLARR